MSDENTEKSKRATEKKNIVIGMPRDLRRNLGIAAMAHGTTISGLVRSVCYAYLAQKSTQEKMSKFIDLVPDMDFD